ncbi:DUF1508 domain-containing protein [Halorussus gelatinilyticus]|uniref:DUF1508 domain-containing protein n=1 Tax=Halorussus gelatinilyticus TaxID=2937524 RepID=A0A8U0IL95_9EURY|nr:HVO_2922 family protein [Halorussus gelatinilyticus]UPW01903.1 DUF1508 domain-containing protein [Halorussus gelatinilyticus]
MSGDDEYETEMTATRDDVATVLSGVIDGITAGSIRLGDGADAVSVEVPEDITLEIELEAEDDELSLELELEWPRPEVEESADSPTESSSGEPIEDPSGEYELAAPVGAADASQTLARFEVFRDRADEWRWRLRHRNGNVIATSGEGYTRKHNAQKGLRSVVQNAPEAEVVEDSER